MQCKKHPQYRGEQRPMYRCSTCWTIWSRKDNPNTKKIADLSPGDVIVKWKSIPPSEIPNEIIIEVEENYVQVTQKPMGVALTVRDFRAKNADDFITHYGVGQSTITIAEFTNPTFTDINVIDTGEE